MTTLRKLARAYLPYALRLRAALLRRAWRDYRAGTVFAGPLDSPVGARFTHSDYALPFIDYPGQEPLAEAKRNNQRLLAAALDGAVLRPGETFSLWHLAGRPKPEQGYAPAAAIREHQLITELGGATCLLSTVVYNAALLAGLDIVERWCHSVDSYGADRYFELGRDCAIVYGYRDLRFRNPFDYPVVLGVWADSHLVRASVSSTHPLDFAVELEVSEPAVDPSRSRQIVGRCLRPGDSVEAKPGHDGIRTHTVRRLVWPDGRSREDDLGESVHVRIDRIVRVGPGDASETLGGWRSSMLSVAANVLMAASGLTDVAHRLRRSGASMLCHWHRRSSC